MPVVGVTWDSPLSVLFERGVKGLSYDLYVRFSETTGEFVLFGGTFKRRICTLSDGAVTFGKSMLRLIPGRFSDEQLKSLSGNERTSAFTRKFSDEDVRVNSQLHV